MLLLLLLLIRVKESHDRFIGRSEVAPYYVIHAFIHAIVVTIAMTLTEDVKLLSRR
jgi:hypothetical protein